MNKPKRVICDDIELRLITPRSANQLFALAKEPDLTRFLSWYPHKTIEDSLDFIHHSQKLTHKNTAWMMGIFLRETSQLIGTTAIFKLNESNPYAEGGTWIGLPYQRQGYNLKAKAALLTYAFSVLQLNRVEFLVISENKNSMNAMRKLPQIREEGVLAQRHMKDDVIYDTVMFALLKNDFDSKLWPVVTIES